MGYAWSPFRNFESYLRIVAGLDEDNIQMILEEFNSFFITHEIPPGIYTISDFSEVVYTMGGHERTIQIEKVDVSMKTKIILTRFRLTIGTLRFDENLHLIHY